MRALVQGVPLRESWSRYLHPGDDALHDAALMRATVHRIRDAFAASARRERRHGIARLVLVDLSRLPDDDPQALPSLEVFAAERGLEDFSEAEQIEAYEAAHGRAAKRVGRRARLVERQLEALRWLETLTARPPQLDDPVDAWLAPALAERLAVAGLATLRSVVERRQGAWGRWWRPVPGVGAAKAARVERWLDEHAAVLGATSHAHPSEDAGTYRGKPPAGSPADRQVLAAWLGSKRKASAHTLRAYQREADRFLLWAGELRGITLRSATTADAQAYLHFIADPRPRAAWCGPRHHPRQSPLWRPFEGPLSAGARRQTVTILHNLYAFLAAQGQVAGNPWQGAAAGCSRRPALDTRRSLSRSQCSRVERRLHLLPDTAANARLRLAWGLMQRLGLRLSEATSARLADLCGDAAGSTGTAPASRTPPPPPTLWLQIPGPAERQRELKLPPDLVDMLQASLAPRSLSPDLLHPANADAFLLGQAADFGLLAPGLAAGRPVDPRQGIAPQTLADQFKRLFRQCAADARAAGDLSDAQALQQASSHWLRHTHGLQALAGGVALATAQGRLGHASPATTALYRRPLAPRQNVAGPSPST